MKVLTALTLRYDLPVKASATSLGCSAVAIIGRLRLPTLDVIDRLREKGVETVNLFAVFRGFRQTAEREVDGAMYLAHDTHWSPRGVRLAAEGIAERIHRLDWLVAGECAYQRNAVEIQRDGDIVRMMQLPDHQRFYTAAEMRCQQIIRKRDSLVYRDDPHSPVLLLGDSFSGIYHRDEPGSARLIAQLAYELKMPLTSISGLKGGNRYRYLTRPTNCLAMSIVDVTPPLQQLLNDLAAGVGQPFFATVMQNC